VANFVYMAVDTTDKLLVQATCSEKNDILLKTIIQQIEKRLVFQWDTDILKRFHRFVDQKMPKQALAKIRINCYESEN